MGPSIILAPFAEIPEDYKSELTENDSQKCCDHVRIIKPEISLNYHPVTKNVAKYSLHFADHVGRSPEVTLVLTKW